MKRTPLAIVLLCLAAVIRRPDAHETGQEAGRPAPESDAHAGHPLAHRSRRGRGDGHVRHPALPEGQVRQDRRPPHQASQPVPAGRVLQGRRQVLLHQPAQGDPGGGAAQGVDAIDGRGDHDSGSEDGRRPVPAALGGRDGGGLRRSPSRARGRPPQARARLGVGPAELRSVARVLRDRRHERRQEGRHRRAPGAHRRRPAPRLAGRRQGSLLGVAARVHRRGQAGEGFARLRRRGGRRHRRGRPDGHRLRLPRQRSFFRVRRREGRLLGGPDRASHKGFLGAGDRPARCQRGREARHRGLARLDGRQEGRGRGPGAGARVPVPGPGQGLGVEKGRHRRRLLLEQPERPGTTTPTARRTCSRAATTRAP